MTDLIVNCETGETTYHQPEQVQPDPNSAWIALRQNRNHLLAESDWTVLGDSPTPTAAWKVYRQALRDLPANTTDPFQPVWPTPPS